MSSSQKPSSSSNHLHESVFKSERAAEKENDEILPPLEVFFESFVKSSSLESLESDVLPCTPLTDEQLQGSEFSEAHLNPLNHVQNDENDGNENDEEDVFWRYEFREMMSNAAEQAEDFAMTLWHKLQSWKVIDFHHLPQWLQDNDFLHFGHRPPLSTSECFNSIFRIHTETGNIWTHLLGVVAFLGLASYFLSSPSTEISNSEKIAFSAFFVGAVICMGMSFTYHTLCCHRDKGIGRLFAKFDYCGIAVLTVGSFVPWLYYSFYCYWLPQIVYLSIVMTLGVIAVIVSTFDFFAGPKFRSLRACVFIVFGLSGIAPATHYGIENGWEKSMDEAALGWLILMGVLYITGALLYATRIPERFFPGKVDIWFHSHQIFHCFVMGGAFVHYHGISQMAYTRLLIGECENENQVTTCNVPSLLY